MNRIQLGLFAIASASLAQPALAQSSDEAQKQATRLISQAISDRVSRSIDLAAIAGPGSSAAGGKGLWGLGSYSDGGLNGAHSFDLYLASGGYDDASGKFVYGLSGSYAHFVTPSINLPDGGGRVRGIKGDSLTLSPYGAYKLSNNAFLSGIFSFNYAHSAGIDSESLGTELAFNAFTKADRFTLRGKIAYRGSLSLHPKAPAGQDDLNSTAVGFVEAEAGLSAHSSFYVNFEANDGLNDNSDRIFSYAGVGFVARPTDHSQFGIGYQRAVSGAKGFDLNTFLVQFRSSF